MMNKKLYQILLFAVSIVIVLWLVDYLKSALMPFLVAGFFAYITAPLANKLETKIKSPALCALIVLTAIICIFLISILLIVPLLIQQAIGLGELLRTRVAELIAWLQIQATAYDITIEDLPWHNIDFQKIGEFVLSYIFGSGIAFALSTISFMILFPLSLYYLLVGRQSIKNSIIELTKAQTLKPFVLFCQETDDILSKFFKGQFLVIITMIVVYSTLLAITGLNSSLIIGTLAGLFSFIPFFGTILSVVLSLLVASLQFQSDPTYIIWIVAMLAIGSLIENYVVVPKILGNKVGLHPLMIIFSLVFFGALLGFAGLILAIPLACVAKVGWSHLLILNQNIIAQIEQNE